ncbi:MAG: hydrolase [Bdellovibrionales bacterium]|nr:hydrolase [Bdellovibrionales bacterium]
MASLFVFFTCQTIEPFEINEFIIWNVGQGAFMTISENSICHHIDLGGEHFPSRMMRTCKWKKNSLSYTHWDWDHVGFTKRVSGDITDVCLLVSPGGKSPKNRGRILNGIHRCKFKPRFTWLSPMDSKNSNDNSNVFIFSNFLIPGDSTARAERKWIKRIKLNQIKILVLGHHGSRTSTSKSLLKQLPNLKMAVASARYAVYRHPHHTVIKRLIQKGIPTIRTEDWGNLHFSLR